MTLNSAFIVDTIVYTQMGKKKIKFPTLGIMLRATSWYNGTTPVVFVHFQRVYFKFHHVSVPFSIKVAISMHNLEYQMDSSDSLFNRWVGRHCFNIWLDYWNSMRSTINIFNRYFVCLCFFFYLSVSLHLNESQTLISHVYI